MYIDFLNFLAPTRSTCTCLLPDLLGVDRFLKLVTSLDKALGVILERAMFATQVFLNSCSCFDAFVCSSFCGSALHETLKTSLDSKFFRVALSSFLQEAWVLTHEYLIFKKTVACKK